MELKSGFTTGSCSAAAAKAAAFMLLSGHKKDTVSIDTPAGISYEAKIIEAYFDTELSLCGIIKDSGDDPDVTNGIAIFAKVSYGSDKVKEVKIKGGVGIGKVTRKGLEMPVGEWAINSVPRQMIEKEVTEVMDLFDYQGTLMVEIFAPEGEEIAKKTFNPHMGIEGGISILGTSGIVEPMSKKALLDTIRLDLKMQYEEGNKVAVIVPGNYGETFLTKTFSVNPEKIVACSNFVGDALDYALEIGFEKILFTGHTGKLVKVSGGIMNTHSKEADSRMELMLASLVKTAKELEMELSMELMCEVLDCVTTTAVLEIFEREHILSNCCETLLKDILFHMRKRVGDKAQVECILYENSFGLLAKSSKADLFLGLIDD